MNTFNTFLTLLVAVNGARMNLNSRQGKPRVLADGATTAKASFYTEWATGIGSCGYPAGQDKLIVAMPMDIMADKGNCGKCIEVTHGGKSVVVKVTDSCPVCKEHGRIDLSDVAFEKLADKGAGVIDITWKWTDCGSLGGAGGDTKAGDTKTDEKAK